MCRKDRERQAEQVQILAATYTMADRTSLTITAERRQLEDDARAAVEQLDPDLLPPERFRSAIYDMALANLIDTIENHREYDGDPALAKAFRTRVVRPHYRTELELKRP